VAGAAVSFIGFALPAFLLMIGLSAFYAHSYTLPPVISIFNGLQTVVVAIVANATVLFGSEWPLSVMNLSIEVMYRRKTEC